MEERLLSTTKKSLQVSEILLMFAYVSLAIVSAYPAFLTFDVPFPAILIFFVLLAVVALIGFIKDRDFRLHIIGILLLLRLLLFTINSLFISVAAETFLEQVFTTFCAILIMNICYNQRIDVKNILMPFLILTDVQIFYAVLASGFSLDKSFIVAGIGGSNYVATFLLLCTTYLMFTDKSVFTKTVIFATVLALLATQSFACYLAFAVVIVVWAIRTINWKSPKSVGSAGAVLVIGIIALICFFNSKPGQPVYQLVKTKTEYLLRGNLKNFSSSRTELYAFSWGNIKRHIVFGSINNISNAYPADYRFQGFRTHNIVLESLLLYGIIGSLINVAVLYFFFKECRGKKQFPYLMTFIAVLLHGLFEPNFFTMHFEVVIWLIIGCCLRDDRTVETKGAYKSL